MFSNIVAIFSNIFAAFVDFHGGSVLLHVLHIYCRVQISLALFGAFSLSKPSHEGGSL